MTQKLGNALGLPESLFGGFFSEDEYLVACLLLTSWRGFAFSGFFRLFGGLFASMSECSSLPVKKLYDHLKWHKRLCSWQTKKSPLNVRLRGQKSGGTKIYSAPPSVGGSFSSMAVSLLSFSIPPAFSSATLPAQYSSFASSARSISSV